MPTQQQLEDKEYQDYLEEQEYQSYLNQHSTLPSNDLQDNQKTSPSMAKLEGFGNAATLGYLPHLQALSENVTTPILNKVFGTDVQVDPYIQSRDKNIERQKIQEQEHPVDSLMGKIAGSVVTAPIIPSGKGIKGAMKTGAALGALYNPGDTAGEISPVQLGGRAAGTTIGAATGGLAAFLGGLVNKGAQKMRDIRMVKDEPLAQQVVKEEIGKAASGMQSNLDDLLKTRSLRLQNAPDIEVNPNELDILGDEAKRYFKSSELYADPNKAKVSAENAMTLRKMADDLVNYPQQPLHGKSSPNPQEAYSLANSLRKKIAEVAPEAAKVNEEMIPVIKHKEFLERSTKGNPISAIMSRSRLDRAADLKNIDKLSGSELYNLGQRIENAQKSLIKSPGLSLMGWPRLPLNVVQRPLLLSADILEKTPNALKNQASELPLRGILELKRKANEQ